MDTGLQRQSNEDVNFFAIFMQFFRQKFKPQF